MGNHKEKKMERIYFVNLVMKWKIIFIFYIIGVNMQGQNITYDYYRVSNDGFSQEITLTLNSNQSFAYKFVDDQLCYEDISLSFGKWEQKGDRIYLNVADTLKPKIKFEKQFLKKDTLTIYFNRANEKAYFDKGECVSGKSEFEEERKLLFYDKNNEKIEISYNYGSVLEIPISKGVKKIEVYIPNDNYKDNYSELIIPENTGQIFINNLSSYLITDFGRYSFILKRHKIIMEYGWSKYKLKRGK